MLILYSAFVRTVQIPHCVPDIKNYFGPSLFRIFCGKMSGNSTSVGGEDITRMRRFYGI